MRNRAALRNGAAFGRWELVGSLPVLGSAHPLRRNANRTLGRAAAITLGLYLTGPLAAVLYDHFREQPAPRPSVVDRREFELRPPPSLDPGADAPQALNPDVQLPGVGIPEPVPDFQADCATVVSFEDFVNTLTTPAQAEFDPARDTIVVSLDAPERMPTPAEIVPVEVPPALIRLPAPVYPEIARMAGVEGSVLVRILVGPKGTVLDAFVVEGHVMLKDAALASARGALYSPALQQNHPVAVWANQRITFWLD